MSSTKTNKLAAFLLVTVSVFVTLIGFECFLRWEDSYEHYPYSQMKIKGETYPFVYPVEKLFRKDDSANKKTNVLLIGDSFVSAIACAKEKQNLSGHLQTLLGDGIEVVNLGVGGKDPANYIDFLMHFPIRKDDLIVVVLYDNDIHMSKDTCRTALRQKGIFPPLHVPDFCSQLTTTMSVQKDEDGFLRQLNQVLKDRSKLFQLIKESAYNIPGVSNLFYRSEFTKRWNDFNADETKWILSTLPIMREIVEQKGARFLLTYYPNTNAISAEDPRHKIWLDFGQYVLEKSQIKLHDPYPFFVQHAQRKSMVWSLTDKHPSCDAHALMAQFLLDRIK